MFESHKVLLVEKKGDVYIMGPAGDAVGFRDADVEAEMSAITEVLHEEDAPKLIIDLSSSRYFGSIIIGIIVNFKRIIDEAKGDMCLCSVSDEMTAVFSVMKLDDYLAPMFDSRKEAMKHFKG